MALSFLKFLAALEESLQTPFLPLPPPQPAAGSAEGRVHAGGRAAPGGTCAPQNHCVPSPGCAQGSQGAAAPAPVKSHCGVYYLESNLSTDF